MERRIAPRLKHAQVVYEEVLEEQVRADNRWLDLGCGRQLLPLWRAEQERRLLGNCKMIVGIDADLPSLQAHQSITMKVAGDVVRLPFQDASFDLVTANMVVEHLDRPEAQFLEVNRILTPRGTFVFHTPHAYGYIALLARMVPNSVKPRLVRLVEGREEQDWFPTYYRANSRKSIAALAAATGFKVVQIRLVVSGAEFAVFPPLAFLELLWIRLLMTKPLKGLRTNLIVILEK